MHDEILKLTNTATGLAVDIWLWVTVGLIAIIAFFGRRLTKKWDSVVESHMPAAIIEQKFAAMVEENDRERKELAKAVGEVHTRLDTLYELLLQRRK